ncbi:hypothetical protein [Paraburkholderia unamae]|uniref:Uncharacterized protein n=1 Tax=Paraburkholderia unamae TaxID=219649 RepID=A0ACC6RGU8_9BURK
MNKTLPHVVVTEWFDGLKFYPDKPGVYEIAMGGTSRHLGHYAKWDGMEWRVVWLTISDAERSMIASSALNGSLAFSWRGIDSNAEWLRAWVNARHYGTLIDVATKRMTRDEWFEAERDKVIEHLGKYYRGEAVMPSQKLPSIAEFIANQRAVA